MARNYIQAARRSLRAWPSATAATGLATWLALAPARADQVTEQMHAAEAAYAHRNYAVALGALASAAAMIRQAKADAWKSVLPPPPPGWAARPASAIAVAPALLGGGIGAERHYFRADGATVDISLVADSPALQSIAPLLGAGLLVSGSDVMVIDGQRVSYAAAANTLQAIVADKVLVKVEASAGVPEHTLEGFFRAIDMAAIERAAR